MELQNVIELRNIMEVIRISKEFKGKSSSTSKSSSALMNKPLVCISMYKIELEIVNELIIIKIINTINV